MSQPLPTLQTTQSAARLSLNVTTASSPNTSSPNVRSSEDALDLLCILHFRDQNDRGAGDNASIPTTSPLGTWANNEGSGDTSRSLRRTVALLDLQNFLAS